MILQILLLLFLSAYYWDNWLHNSFNISLLPNIQALSNFNMDNLHSTCLHVYTYRVFLPSFWERSPRNERTCSGYFSLLSPPSSYTTGRVRVKDRQSGWAAMLSNGVFRANRERVQCRAGIRVPGLLVSIPRIPSSSPRGLQWGRPGVGGLDQRG